MFTQALLPLSINAQQINPNQGNQSTQPITDVILNNNSPVFVLVTSGSITDYIAPFSPYKISYNPPTASPNAIMIQALSPTTGNLAVTVYQQGDTVPNVSLGTGAPTSVGIDGNVTVEIANTPDVIVSGGTIDIGNTPAVTISSGTVDISNISAGTVDIGTVGSVIDGSTSETQQTVDASSVVPSANVATSISPSGTLGTYIRVGIVSIYNADSSPGTISLSNGAGVIFFYVAIPGSATPGPWSFPINHNVYNSSPGGIFVTASINPVRVTITHNVNMTVHA